MEEMLRWEDIEDEIETLTDSDIADAEAMGRLPVGKFLCTCIDSQPRQVNLTNYTCMAANVKFVIDQVLEINGEPVDPAEFEHLEGRYIWDSIFLPHPEEKDGMKKRRILIAKRFGVIGNGRGNDVSNKTWAQDILNKQIILTTEESTWTDRKTGALKKNTQVAFGGYDAVANHGTNSKTAAGADSFADI